MRARSFRVASGVRTTSYDPLAVEGVAVPGDDLRHRLDVAERRAEVDDAGAQDDVPRTTAFEKNSSPPTLRRCRSCSLSSFR